MIALASGNLGVNDAQSLRIFLTSAPTPGFEPHFTSSWAEFNDLDPGANSVDIRSTLGTVDNLAIQTLIDFPAPGRQRQAKWISVFNPDSVTHFVQIFLRTTTIDRIVFQIDLGPQENLNYVDTRGFYIITRNGSEKVTGNSTQQVTRFQLSGSSGGIPIGVVAIATPGTLIHTAVSGFIFPNYDEIWLWANNRSNAPATLTVEFGGVTNAEHLVEALSIPANSSPYLICQGLILNNSLVVRAFSGTANAINISGFINRIRA